MQLAVYTMISPKIEQNAKETLTDFLRVYSKKYFIKVKFKVFFERCKSICFYLTFSEQNTNQDQKLPRWNEE
jgi:hypothetical protein